MNKKSVKILINGVKMEFIETMYVKNGNILNLEYHIKRMRRTINYFKWKMENGKWKINHIIKNGEWRIRITYTQSEIKNIEYFPIKKREFKTFKLIEIDFDYSFKYTNRKLFSSLHSQFSTYDEFILVKNHLITDTTISNLAFFTGSEWLTPKYPLLKGTKREELLKKGLIKEDNIHKSDLKYFKKMAMINAILGFYEIDEYDIIR